MWTILDPPTRYAGGYLRYESGYRASKGQVRAAPALIGQGLTSHFHRLEPLRLDLAGTLKNEGEQVHTERLYSYDDCQHCSQDDDDKAAAVAQRKAAVL